MLPEVGFNERRCVRSRASAVKKNRGERIPRAPRPGASRPRAQAVHNAERLCRKRADGAKRRASAARHLDHRRPEAARAEDALRSPRCRPSSRGRCAARRGPPAPDERVDQRTTDAAATRLGRHEDVVQRRRGCRGACSSRAPRACRTRSRRSPRPAPPRGRPPRSARSRATATARTLLDAITRRKRDGSVCVVHAYELAGEPRDRHQIALLGPPHDELVTHPRDCSEPRQLCRPSTRRRLL